MTARRGDRLRLNLELAPATAEAFARFLDLAHGSFIELLADSADDAEAMHHAASLVRGQIALQGVAVPAWTRQ